MHDVVVRDLEAARNRTLGLTDLDEPTLVAQHDPLMCGIWPMSASKKSCGCCDDPDYIWRQVDCGPARDAASYYIRAAESGGEPPGRWWGRGAKALGLEPGQVVDREPYDLLFGEWKAPDGAPLGRPPGASCSRRTGSPRYREGSTGEPWSGSFVTH